MPLCPRFAKRTLLTLILAAFSLSALPAPASAGPGQSHDDRGPFTRPHDAYNRFGHEQGGYGPRFVSYTIADRDRARIRAYLGRSYCERRVAGGRFYHDCEAYRHFGPRPSIGAYYNGPMRDLWGPLVRELAPPPAGYRYVRADDSVLLVSLFDRRIVDIVAIF